MKNEEIIEGQINIFDLPIVEYIKPKEKDAKALPKKRVNTLDNIVNLYGDSCSRIVKTFSGAVLVELDNKTLYFNGDGVNEFELTKDVGIMPGEEIIIANKDKELNDLQKEKLKDLKPKEYIKRKGDTNLIIPGEKTMVINPKGWVLQYEQKPKYKDDEIFKIDILESNINQESKFEIGDKVQIEYMAVKAIGKVVRIYNNGETLNVAWDGKRAAFYYKNVIKIKE